MSGTSLDGVDLAFCQFNEVDGKLNYQILHTKAIDYDGYWKNTLQNLVNVSAKEFVEVDAFYGEYLGILISNFMNEIGMKSDLIASHGHTIFHEPQAGFTTQIGNANAIYAKCEVPVVSDFRSLDVQLAGTGAPLVPLGDQLLFGTACVNLGGIANLSYQKNGKTIAYDISPFNLLLNHLAKKFGQEYDKGGEIASKGTINQNLLDDLNRTDYYNQPFPKSLDKSWVEKYFFSLIDSYSISIEDKMRTLVEHIVTQINSNLSNVKKVLFTGGGTHHAFFINRLKDIAAYEIEIPSDEIIDYKEALIFAFLGLRRLQNKANVLREVTGALSDNIGGSLVGDFSKCFE